MVFADNARDFVNNDYLVDDPSKLYLTCVFDEDLQNIDTDVSLQHGSVEFPVIPCDKLSLAKAVHQEGGDVKISDTIMDVLNWLYDNISSTWQLVSWDDDAQEFVQANQSQGRQDFINMMLGDANL